MPAVPRRVFLSHTSELGRLPEGRSFVDAAVSAVIRAGDAVTDMAYFAARDDKPAHVCREAVQSADVYVLMAGFQYGSVVRDDPTSSYTELEYDTACQFKLPRLVFLLDESATGTRELLHPTTHGDRQDAFRSELTESGVTTARFTTPDNLETAVLHALQQLPRGARSVSEHDVPRIESIVEIPALRGDEIDRPQLLRKLIAALTENSSPAGAGLVGAGGFGKSTLARMAAHDQRLHDAFPDGRLWITIGEDLHGPDLAAAIISTARRLDPDLPHHSDPLEAGRKLGAAIGDRRILLIIDDVWSTAQVEPFLQGAGHSVRLFTARQRRGLFPSDLAAVNVDRMTATEVSSLLTARLPSLPPRLLEEVRDVCGSWPVLLSLVHGAALDAVRRGGDATTEMEAIATALRTDGITVLDVHVAAHRSEAVAKTIGVSLDRISSGERDRYLELSVFAKDLLVPMSVIARLWSHTGGLSRFQTERLCERLYNLGLLATYNREADAVQLHDVIRAYLRQLTAARRKELDEAIVDAHRSLVGKTAGGSQWAGLDPDEKYLWEWLATHLSDAGLADERDRLLDDATFLVRKLDIVGPAGLEGDLLLSHDPRRLALASLVRQNAHALDKIDPAGSLAATFASRIPRRSVAHAGIRAAIVETIGGPHLGATVDPPDLPHPALARILSGHTDEVRTLAFAPDGSWLASAGDDRQLRVWDLKTGSARTGHGHPISTLAAAPDGTWIASGDTDGTVRIWNPATAEPVRSLVGHEAPVHALLVAPDGTWLASGSNDETVRIWDPHVGSCRHVLRGHTDYIRALTVGPDGSWLASGGGDGSVRLWDPLTGAARMTLDRHTRAVWMLLSAPDGSWLASASEDGTVCLWDPNTGAALDRLGGHTKDVWALAVDPEGRWLASASWDMTVRLWDLPTRKSRHVLDCADQVVYELAVAADGSWLATGGASGAVDIWDPASGERRHRLAGHTARINALAVDPRKGLLASGGSDFTVQVVDPATAPQPSSADTYTGRLQWLAVAGDGTWIASADGSKTIRVWGDDGVLRHVLGGHAEAVWALVTAPDSTWLASAGDDQRVLIWDVAKGAVLHVLDGHFGSVRALALGPDGSWIASGGVDKTVRIWDVDEGTATHVMSGHTGGVLALAAAPDGSWLASAGDDGSVRIWNPETGETRHVLTGHTNPVHHLAIAPNGGWLASAGDDGSVRVWNPETGLHLHTLVGHTKPIAGLAVAPDGTWVASASRDRTIRVWDPATGATMHELVGHSDAVWAIAASGSGAWIASVGEDRTVRIWDPATGQNTASLRVGHPLYWVADGGEDRLIAAGERGPYLLAVQHAV